MDKVRWHDSLSVGVDNLDQQHKSLIGLLNMQIRRSEGGQGLKELKDMLKRLKRYSQIHFESEEEIFDKIGYPDAERHIKIHQSFIEKIEEYEKDLNNRKSGLPEDVKQFLADWFLTHIKEEDSKYSKFLQEKLEKGSES